MNNIPNTGCCDAVCRFLSRRLPAMVFVWLVLPVMMFAQLSGYPMSRDDIAARLADLERIHTPEGIEVLEPVEVNGSTQWISIRGLNRANPILLFVHGGPASPMMGMTWAYQKPWEDFFTVVNWDQRGVGKNYSVEDKERLAPTMTEAQHIMDAEVIVQHVLERLGQDKLIIMGYSWGTKFTRALVQEHPELFHAWVGVGVIGSNTNAEQTLYDRVLYLAEQSADTTAVQELQAIAPYPDPAGFNMRKALAVRKWVRMYDGGWYGKPDLDLYYSLHEWSPNYTTAEAANVLDATSWGGRLITQNFQQNTNTKFEVPVIFLMGRYDLHTPYENARMYFDRIEAPRKQFVTFERSSHMVMFEEPGRFLMTLVNEVLPLAGGAASFEPMPDPVKRR